MKYIDDENMNHKIFKKRKKFFLESEIVYFGSMMGKKYDGKSIVTYGPFVTENDALDALRSITLSIKELT